MHDRNNHGRIEHFRSKVGESHVRAGSARFAGVPGSVAGGGTRAIANAGDDAITVDIPGTGPHRIVLSNDLLNFPVIDRFTADGSASVSCTAALAARLGILGEAASFMVPNHDPAAPDLDSLRYWHGSVPDPRET